MTVQESFDNFILSRRLSDLSDKTVTNYLQFLQPFVASIGPDREFSSITQTDINGYIAGLLKRPLSRSTRATYIRHLKIYLRWSENEYGAAYCSRGIKVPKSPKREVRIYSDDEVSRIFQAIECETPWLTLRNKSVIALMYDSGLRQSEVCSLRNTRISYTENRMTVRGKGDKERVVPLGRLTQHYLREYLRLCPFESDFVFLTRRGTPLTGNAVKLMVTKLANRLPFELSSHKLRHNFATNYCIDQYEQHGQIDIYRLMYLMGHEDIETTRRYLHFAYEVIASRGCISHLDSIYSKET